MTNLFKEAGESVTYFYLCEFAGGQSLYVSASPLPLNQEQPPTPQGFDFFWVCNTITLGKTNTSLEHRSRVMIQSDSTK